MNTATTRLIYWAGCAIWTMVLSILSVIRFAPQAAHADIMMNSIMSLQNLSLFYWGQNRLLSVLPLALFPFSDPQVNFWMCLFFTSLTFYSLLIAFSWTAIRFYRSQVPDADVLLVFLVSSTLFLFMISDSGAVIFLLGHIEYSLSALLFLLATNLFFGRSDFSLIRNIFAATLLFIGMGVNPSIILLGSFSVAAFLVWRRRMIQQPMVFAGAALICFLVWRGIANLYSGISQYESFSLDTLRQGLPLVAVNMSKLVSPMAVALVVFALMVLYFAILREKWRAAPESRGKLIFITLSVLCFSLVWVLFFSGNYWVQINLYRARYFTFVVFAFLFLMTFHLTFYANILRWRSKLILGLASALLSIPLLASPFLPISDFRIFREVNTMTPPGSALYAGNYWVVWPTVLRDMFHGFDSLGLGYRGDGNSADVIATVRAKIESNGHFDVICLSSSDEKCLQTIEYIVGPVRMIEGETIRDRVRISDRDRVRILRLVLE